jgi:uncharacterized protein YbjT (DUF2867 family)
LSEPIGF